VQEMTRHTVQRILSQFDLDNELCEWEGMEE
jgi:3-polyprenyl-4-hydroxybenzoate decarboxylase